MTHLPLFMYRKHSHPIRGFTLNACELWWRHFDSNKLTDSPSTECSAASSSKNPTKDISLATNIIQYINIHHLLLWCDGSVFFSDWQQLHDLTSSDSFRSIVWLDAAPRGRGRGRQIHWQSFLVVHVLWSPHIYLAASGLRFTIFSIVTIIFCKETRENSGKLVHLYGVITWWNAALYHIIECFSHIHYHKHAEDYVINYRLPGKP